jgi:phosphoglycolate phosphatase-like HAD superfamily hydrolase
MPEPEPVTDLCGCLAQFDVVIFDLDGVVLDSNELKVACMQATLAEFEPAVAAAFLAEFRRTFGRSRLEHFRSLYENHLRRAGGFEQFYEVYAGKYARQLARRYPKAPMCEHARELLLGLVERRARLCVVTGTPSDEAEHVLSEHGVRSCFDAVLGGEQGKVERIAQVLGLYDVGASQVVLIGDAPHDRAAAAAAGIAFVFVERYALWSREEVMASAPGLAYFVYDLAASDGRRPVLTTAAAQDAHT